MGVMMYKDTRYAATNKKQANMLTLESFDESKTASWPGL